MPELPPSFHIHTPDLTQTLIAEAIANIIGSAKSNGRTLEELTEEVLSDDQVLDSSTRQWLSDIVCEAWELPVTDDSYANAA